MTTNKSVQSDYGKGSMTDPQWIGFGWSHYTSTVASIAVEAVLQTILNNWRLVTLTVGQNYIYFFNNSGPEENVDSK